jgi:hypothetical protein
MTQRFDAEDGLKQGCPHVDGFSIITYYLTTIQLLPWKLNFLDLGISIGAVSGGSLPTGKATGRGQIVKI